MRHHIGITDRTTLPIIDSLHGLGMFVADLFKSRSRSEWLARQITEAFPWTSALAYLVRDNDRA
jgi:hypothetical protein